jgi:hypothetical protein
MYVAAIPIFVWTKALTGLQAVMNTHVNIVDLIDTQKTGEPVHVFESELALSRYTRAKGKIFPLHDALSGGLLRFLLRRIFNPPKGH